MDILTAADLRKLAEVRGPNCVSIYFETHRTGKETRQDPLRLKGRLDDVEQQLTAADMRSVERRKLLAPAKQLLDDETFWSDQSDGLCILLNPDLIRTFRLPRSFPDLAIVGSRFHLTPLLPLVVDNVEYHILAFSPSRVRFFTATRDTVESRAVEALPKSIEELEQYIETERSLQFHTRAAPASSGKRAGVFHGQGVGTDDTLRQNAAAGILPDDRQALRPILSSSRSPLVLAADEALVPLYRKATSYRHLVDQSVTGNPDLLSERKLRDAAWQIVSQRNGVHRTERLAAFHEAGGRKIKPRLTSNRSCRLPPPAEYVPSWLLISNTAGACLTSDSSKSKRTHNGKQVTRTS